MAVPSRYLWLGFGKAQKKVRLKALDDGILGGKFDDMFEHFPFISPEPVFSLPHEPQINNSEGLSLKITFSEALAWGNGIDTDSSVFFPTFHGEGDEQQKFCVKVLFNVEKAEPDDNCYKAADKMLADAKFYGQNLRGVAGVLVPRHYGVWRARTGEWGGTMLCSITEWAGTPWTQLVAAGRATTDLAIKLGRSVERLHDRGIHHHTLYIPADLHHLLFRVDKTAAGSTTTCFVIDFSRARMTPCTRNLPILPVDLNDLGPTVGCEEALNLIYILRMYHKDVKVELPSSHLYRAIRFVSHYSAQHPSLSNAEVMLVQRHHFFADEPPLEPDITFEFRADGKVVFNRESSDTLTKCLSEAYISSILS
ncbi:hypothetical protein CPB85DRAFT_1340875 [Mucidula mucida]|nr:hypothetical protein CPB85DRAFT_1340875 [Mucidula mucida]